MLAVCDRDTSCDILTKNVPAFCPSPKDLLEPNLERFDLIAWAEEISWQPTVDSVMCFVIIIMQVYSKKEQVRQKAIQNLQYDEEQSPREFNIGAMVCNKRQVGVEKRV